MKQKYALNYSGARWYLDNIDIYEYPNGSCDDEVNCIIYIAMCRVLGVRIPLNYIRNVYQGKRVTYKTPFGIAYNNVANDQLEKI